MPKHFPLNHHYIFLAGLSLMAIGLPVSKFLMSISQFVLIGNWLLEGDIKQKLKNFSQNKAALALSSVFLLHIAGLIHTSDFTYALKDIKIKLPILLMPLILATSPPLTRKEFTGILTLFVSSVLISTIISTVIAAGLTTKKIIDMREISIFISHIRFSLLICLSILICAYYFHRERTFSKKIILAVISLWLIAFLFIMKALTGLVILFIAGLILVTFYLFSQRRFAPVVTGTTLLILAPLTVINYLAKEIKKYNERQSVNFDSLEQFTIRGNPYFHDPHEFHYENGYYVWQYVSWKELEEEWNKQSQIKFHERDLKGNEIKLTLIRFLTSKGFRKDADGIKQLSKSEIASIELGVANVNYQHIAAWDLTARIQQILWELDHYFQGGNPSGHSVSQRLEFWKAAIGIIKENILFGVGTGDPPQAFEKQYKKMNSLLDEKFRLRSHNQFLAIAVAFGILGAICFAFSLVYPLLSHRVPTYLYACFFIIAVLSMLHEDTLETQAGVSFFAFFNALFLFSKPKAEDVPA